MIILSLLILRLLLFSCSCCVSFSNGSIHVEMSRVPTSAASLIWNMFFFQYRIYYVIHWRRAICDRQGSYPRKYIGSYQFTIWKVEISSSFGGFRNGLSSFIAHPLLISKVKLIRTYLMQRIGKKCFIKDSHFSDETSGNGKGTLSCAISGLTLHTNGWYKGQQSNRKHLIIACWRLNCFVFVYFTLSYHISTHWDSLKGFCSPIRNSNSVSYHNATFLHRIGEIFFFAPFLPLNALLFSPAD